MNDTQGHQSDIVVQKERIQSPNSESFVLEKSIFNNVFAKDIQRIYLYKKAERLAKAIQLIVPAFKNNDALHERLERISVGLIDASIMPSHLSREALSKELLALSSILGIAKSAGLLSPMNADFILQESHNLLQEVAGYEEPRVAFDEVASIAALARASVVRQAKRVVVHANTRPQSVRKDGNQGILKNSDKGHVKDSADISDRRDSILSVIRSKGTVYIKDVSMVIRNVSEKTIQRELQALVVEGVLVKAGERRWTRYSIA